MSPQFLCCGLIPVLILFLAIAFYLVLLYNLVVITSLHHNLIKMMFDTNTIIPLYYQLKLHIESQIRSGIWQPGDQVPSESVLGEKFHVSRTTVRQALGELVNQGLLTRVQGKGTFVAHPRIRQRLNRLTGFTEDFQARFMKPASQILRHGKEPAGSRVAAALRITEGTAVIVLERLRLANDLPMAVEISHLREDLFPSFNAEEFPGGSLYTYLAEKFNTIATTAHQDIEAIGCPPVQAHLLGIPKNGPVLYMNRTTFDQSSRPFEQVESFYRGDRYVFQAELKNESLNSG
jgi:GntR family transcriptional regulator